MLLAQGRAIHVTPRSVARHAVAATLLLAAYHFLNRWEFYQHPVDSFLLYAFILSALVLAGGPELLRAMRQLPVSRIAVFLAMVFFAFPWGEWLRSDAFARENWSRQIYFQILWVYPAVAILRLFPEVAHRIRLYFVRAVGTLAERPLFLHALPVLFFVVATYIALGVYKSVPIVNDSASYLFQARIFSEGKLYAPEPAVGEFFSYPGDGAVIHDGRWFSMYQPGYPAFLAMLIPFGAEWFLSPFLGALTLWLWIAYARRWHGKHTAVLIGLLLFFSPFFLAMSGTIMAHPLELFLASVILFVCRIEMEKHARWRSLLLGVTLLCGMPVRGFSLLAFTLPALAFVSWKHISSRKYLTPAAIAVGALAGIAIVGIYQWKTTGSPAEPGYNLEYNEPVRYGFQETWKGQSHTPFRGLENVSNNWIATNQWLTGWAGGCFLFLFAFLFLEPRLNTWDRVLFLSTLSLIVFYYFYFFQDLIYGPRFWYLLLPLLLLLIARTVDTRATAQPMRTTLTAVVVLFFLTVWPDRLWNFVRQYNPARFQVTWLQNEMKSAGNQKLLVFLDQRISQTLVIMNDPFLKSNVIICRDLHEKNGRATDAFPAYRPMYFRQVTSYGKESLKSGFRFIPDPDENPPGYFSFFELSMNLQSTQYYPTKDIFDVASVDLFTGRTAREHWNYLNSLPVSDSASRRYRDSFREGLVHAARLLLLPRLAFQEGRTAWRDKLDYDGIRNELLSSEESLREAGEVGKPILEQLEKVSRRIDRNEDGVLDNPEIALFFAAKTKFLL